MKSSKRVSVSLIIATLVLGLAGPISVMATGPASVNLGSASNYAVLSKSGISTTGATKVTGNIGVSPINATAITGFGLTMDVSNTYATSALVVGKVYAADYTAPTPFNMTTAVSDMQTAYTEAAGRTNPTATELGAGNIGGMTLAPGLYKWGTGLAIPTDVTLSGTANDVWIFQVGQNLNLSPAKQIILAGGATAKNIFWIVAGQTTIGTTAVFNGNILDQTAIVVNTGAQVNGRMLAQTAVTLDANVVVIPSHDIVVSEQAVVSTPSPTVLAMPVPQSGPTPEPTLFPTPSRILPIVTAVEVSLTDKITENKVLPVGSASIFGQQVKNIVVNLSHGLRNENVKNLQQFLILQNSSSAAKNLTRVGATSYFGPITRAALMEFQKKVRISPARGNFGLTTRAYIKANFQ